MLARRYQLTTGAANTYIGTYAGSQTATTSANNVGVGRSALLTNVTGTNNTAVGKDALSTTTVSDNIGVGYLALAVNTTGASTNTAVGSSALAA